MEYHLQYLVKLECSTTFDIFEINNRTSGIYYGYEKSDTGLNLFWPVYIVEWICLAFFDTKFRTYFGGVPPYMEFTKGSAHAQNFIKKCRKIVYYMGDLFVRYLPIHLFQLLNLNHINFKIKKMDTLIKSGPRRQYFLFFKLIYSQHDA